MQAGEDCNTAGKSPSAHSFYMLSLPADESLTNFSSLFQPDSLYKALLAIKYAIIYTVEAVLSVTALQNREPPGSGLSRNRDGMIRWLSGLADKDEVIMTRMGKPQTYVLQSFSCSNR